MRENSKHWILLPALAIVVLCTALTACGNTSPRNLMESIESGSVILGTKFDQPGLGLRHPDKSFTGFDVAVSEYVVNTIAQNNGWKKPKITWRETPSAQRETLIDNGEVDMIAATYSINAARSKKVSFAGPYLINYQGLLVREDDDSITTLTDLNKGKKLCSVTGSTSAQNVKNQLPKIQLQEYDSYSSCVEALRRNKVDALTTDEAILAGFSDFFPDEFKIVDMTYPKDACVTSSGKKSLKKAGTPFSTERYGIGMPKDYPESVTAVNEALESMLAKPADGGESAWEIALRDEIGDSEVDSMIERAQGPDSKYQFTPVPDDLDFLESTSDPCPAGLS
ncbi:glutamate ABC transporter substrate-binding protein [Williamsia muralis]|uniref:glutamate ABC transporter substrate-binding protein n=1 Tax=Williamsia marianensis TaxID=85044 RepID=UPI003F1711FF